MTPAGKAKKHKAKTIADYEAFKATAGGWKEMDTYTLLAKMYARVGGELAQKGLLIDQPDLFIAATAIEHNLLLVTRNRKDFGRIPDPKLYQ